LKTAAAQLHALHKDVAESVAKDTNPSNRIRAEVMVAEADALQLVAEGKRADALKVLEEAAKAEKSMPLEFGPPVVPKPVAELLGDQLLAAGRAADAVAAYQSVFTRTPGRTRSMEGLDRARKAAGHGETAAETTAAAPHVH
jgi:hypothetical protein